MINSQTKNSILYQNMEEEERAVWFDRAKSKFIHNIDSLYYSVTVANDWTNDDDALNFVDYLKSEKEKAMSSFDPHVLFQHEYTELGSSHIMQPYGFHMYSFTIERADCYTMLIAEKVLNEKTPQILVQLRSQNLWLNGEYNALNSSVADVERILRAFNLVIHEIKENRIDFAYHTNHIQLPLNFFKLKDLGRMQESRFERWSMEGKFEDKETRVDYVTLGRKKSNNVFFRIYDKTQEVVQMGYKQFFLQIWLLEKLISRYDFYCYERGFLDSNINTAIAARLEFFIEFAIGCDYVKKQMKDLLNDRVRDMDAIRKIADEYTPALTLICNIEFETKRKFYHTFDSSIDALLSLHSDVPASYRPLYIKLDNKKLFHDWLTRETIRFLDYKKNERTRKTNTPTASWWERLQKVNLNLRFTPSDVDMMRTYQKDVSTELVKRRTVNSAVTHHLYRQDYNTLCDDDDYNVVIGISDLLATLNENDLEKARRKFAQKKVQLRARLEAKGSVTALPPSAIEQQDDVEFYE